MIFLLLLTFFFFFFERLLTFSFFRYLSGGEGVGGWALRGGRGGESGATKCEVKRRASESVDPVGEICERLPWSGRDFRLLVDSTEMCECTLIDKGRKIFRKRRESKRGEYKQTYKVRERTRNHAP